MTSTSTPLEKTSTGVPGLDTIVPGGLPRDRLYLLQGDPGAGKTTLALQWLLHGAAQGESCLYITLSETEDELREVARSHGWSLDQLALFELPASTDMSADADNTLFHPAEVELAETTRLLLAQIERVKPARVVFDSLSEIRLLSQNPLRYRRHVLALKQFFMGRGCTVFLLDDRSSEEGDLQLESIAHGVISLDQLEPLYGAHRRRLRVRKLRSVAFRGGFHDFIIERGGLRVFPRLVAADHRRSFAREKLCSGILALDELVGGGLDPGTSTLLMGPAGTGKSTVAMQYACAATRAGARANIFTFDESSQTIFTRAAGIGLDLEQQVREGRLEIRQVDPAELTPGEFAHAVRDAVEQRKASVVVIDSLNGYLHAMPEEHFLTLQLHELLMYLGQMGATTLMVVAQHGFVGAAMQSPIDVSYLADSVMMFRHFETQGRLRKAISMVKKRTGAHESMIRELVIGSKGLTVGRPLEGFRGVLTGLPGREDAQYDERSLGD
jgi:circadian clock protein KaiC